MTYESAQLAYDHIEPSDPESDLERDQRYAAAEAAIQNIDFADDIACAWVPLRQALATGNRNLVGELVFAIYNAQIERLARRMDCNTVPQDLLPEHAAELALLLATKRGEKHE